MKLDPTTRRCLTWSREWGCSRYVMLNAYGYRATRPQDMFKADDPIGLENDETIKAFCSTAKFIIAAWGGNCDSLRQEAVCKLIGKHLECLGLNGDGTPKHPLYVPGATQRTVFWTPTAIEGVTTDMSLSQKILKIKRDRHEANYAWGHAEALQEASELALKADETITDLLAACKRALHLVEENNEEIVQMSGSFGLLSDLQSAIAKAEGETHVL